MAEFRRVIIRGVVGENESDFIYNDFRRVIVEFDKQFLDAVSGYGRHYGMLYGSNF